MVAALGGAGFALRRGLVNPVWRHVGGIGFQHQAGQRQRGGQTAQLLGTRVGQGTTKAEFQTQVDEGLCLLRTAVESVGNTLPLEGRALGPGRTQVAQAFEQPVSRTAHMQNHRQAVLARQLQLRPVEKFLALTQGALAQRGHKEVQPDLAHSHQTRVVAVAFQRVVQRLQVANLRLRHIQGMNAQGVAVAAGVGELAHSVKVGPLDGGQHAMHHVVRSGQGAHCRRLVAKLCRVQVAMGVNPVRHAWAGRNSAAFSPGLVRSRPANQPCLRAPLRNESCRRQCPWQHGQLGRLPKKWWAPLE